MSEEINNLQEDNLLKEYKELDTKFWEISKQRAIVYNKIKFLRFPKTLEEKWIKSCIKELNLTKTEELKSIIDSIIKTIVSGLSESPEINRFESYGRNNDDDIYKIKYIWKGEEIKYSIYSGFFTDINKEKLFCNKELVDSSILDIAKDSSYFEKIIQTEDKYKLALLFRLGYIYIDEFEMKYKIL